MKNKALDIDTHNMLYDVERALPENRGLSDMVRSVCERLMDEIEGLEDKNIPKLLKEIDEIGDIIDGCKLEITDLKREKENLENDNERLQDDLRYHEKEVDKLNKEILSLKNEIDSLNNIIERL